MLRQLAMFLPIFLAGILLGAWAREPATTPDNARDFDHAADYQRLEQMISSLTEILDLEVAERRRLESRIEELSDLFADMGGQRPKTAGQITAEESKRLATSRVQARGDVRNARDSDVTESRLIEAGFQPDVAARLKRDMDQVAMDRLYLRDQAVREGWLGTPRYRDELRALNQRQPDLRNDLSPDDYDRYLYAMGRPNRIVVSSVLSGSPASQSGLQPGDAILSYDGTRTFSPSTIRRETSSGSPGAMVPVEILRGGQRLIVYVPRGPLGVNMSAASAKP